MRDNASRGLRNIVIDKDLLDIPELTIIEKLVLAYYEQAEPYEKQGSSCSIFLDISESDVLRAKAHLRDLGYIAEGESL